MVAQQITAIIPARGGSKRIPKKNIVELCGKPMISWTIEAALKSDYVSQVIVSTDDEEIAAVAREAGAEVPFLRDENADDHSPISLATVRTIHQMEDAGMEKPEIVVQLMANCPLRDAGDIDNAIKHFLEKGHNFQISSFKYGWMNPWWAHTIDEKGRAAPVFGTEELMKRSQDRPDLYCPTGAIWVGRTEELVRSESFYGPNYSFFPLHWIHAVDIDEYDDLEMAEFFMNRK